jgi:hypothetical protein
MRICQVENPHHVLNKTKLSKNRSMPHRIHGRSSVFTDNDSVALLHKNTVVTHVRSKQSQMAGRSAADPEIEEALRQVDEELVMERL